jgi:hypothetical protein
MGISVSKLRADIYRLLDEVLATGRPLEVDHTGKRSSSSPNLPAD